VVRPEEETFRLARYILENPVRAGLVRPVYDYPCHPWYPAEAGLYAMIPP